MSSGVAVAAFFLVALASAQAAGPGAGEPRASEGTSSADAEAARDAARTQERMQVRKEKADALFREREYVDALAMYEEAYVLVPDPRVLYNMGRTLQALGRYAASLEAFRTFRTKASPELRQQLVGLDELIDGLRQKVSELHVVVNVPGAKVSLGDEVLGQAPLSARLVDAGTARLRVEKAGYFPEEREVTLVGGGMASYEVHLESSARHAKLLVESRVPGTSIQVGPQRLGVAPTEVVLTPGTHTVLARREGYRDSATQVVLEVGQARTITVDPLREAAFYESFWFWGGLGVGAALVVTAVVLSSRSTNETRGDFSPSAISAPLVQF